MTNALGRLSHGQMRSVLWVWSSRGALSKNAYWGVRARIAQEEGRASLKSDFKKLCCRELGLGEFVLLLFNMRLT